METFFSASGHFLFFNNFFPTTVRCGIATNFFGDCNYYYEGRTEDCIKNLGKVFHASDIFIPFPKNETTIIKAQKNVETGIRNIRSLLKKRKETPVIHRADGDGIILRHKKFHKCRPLLIFPTGDCPIVLLHNKKVSALLHCGWRGLQGNILSLAVESLLSQKLIEPAKTKAIIWPGICQMHYPVSENVAQYFPDTVNDGCLDLAGTAHKELLSLKFSRKNITIPDYCSFHSQENEENIFSSHRRGDTTRNAVFILPDLHNLSE
ncbi:polyphenol oxidase family protein [Candidatus Parcubacteria bacterium]|nr:polyphenol oxidase family protein [Patescibacteria group bacterium]MBU4309781.1 polyphenol oxidase family protein [Patescibacteria group bacterium]MBU4431787.1 polyphenol oxidase family protein [Patescibacteria group bacterium]MBU4578120.1 polyphenol oxidase family protein [Patescibacteria group bacterium]MCG2696657.1 polyphenol oxidase family protein [Candidatus Parcubacteria bacterium]